MIKNRAPLLAMVMLTAGCNLAPPLENPPSGLPANFPAGASADPAVQAAYDLAWKDFFRDPVLREFTATALDNNQDLAAATARIAQAEAQFRIQNSLRVPSVEVGGAVQRSETPSPLGSGRIRSTSLSLQVAVPTFELDFWGRVANLSEAARRQYLATFEARQAFRLSLVGSVASAYFIYRSSEEGVELAQRTLESRKHTQELARLRMDAGMTSSVDFDQAAALVNQAQAQLVQFTQARGQALTWLRALTGTDPEPVLARGGTLTPWSGQLREFSTGLPSELLEHRPDVRLAEHLLVAANANIGAARAAFFPSIALTGSNGFASSDLSGLFSSGSNIWSVGVGGLLPIFDMGRRRAQVRFTEAALLERQATYRQTVLNAFQEVHDGLIALEANADRIETLRHSVEVQTSLSDTAQARYEIGLSPYLEVLDAERGLFSAQQALLQAQATDLQGRVNLYLSLGGGDIARAGP